MYFWKKGRSRRTRRWKIRHLHLIGLSFLFTAILFLFLIHYDCRGSCEDGVVKPQAPHDRVEGTLVVATSATPYGLHISALPIPLAPEARPEVPPSTPPKVAPLTPRPLGVRGLDDSKHKLAELLPHGAGFVSNVSVPHAVIPLSDAKHEPVVAGPVPVSNLNVPTQILTNSILSRASVLVPIKPSSNESNHKLAELAPHGPEPVSSLKVLTPSRTNSNLSRGSILMPGKSDARREDVGHEPVRNDSEWVLSLTQSRVVQDRKPPAQNISAVAASLTAAKNGLLADAAKCRLGGCQNVPVLLEEPFSNTSHAAVNKGSALVTFHPNISSHENVRRRRRPARAGPPLVRDGDDDGGGGDIWTAPQISRCGRTFGNGFGRIEPGCGKALECWHNPIVEMTMCEAHDLAINRSRITVAEGGEPVSEVIGRPEEAEMPVYAEGAFVIAASGGCVTTPNEEHFPKHLYHMMTRLVVGQVDCNHWLEGTTLIITRYEYANLYHTMTDWYNAYQTAKFRKIPPKNTAESPLHVVFFDGHSRGTLDEAWEILFGVKPVYVSSLPPLTCFRRALFVPPGYTSVLSITYESHCSKSLQLADFANHFLSRLPISPPPPPPPSSSSSSAVDVRPQKILFIFRKDYMAHPRVGGKPAARKVANKEQVLLRLRRSVPEVPVRAVSLEDLSIREQIEAIREATILVGMHGAGLSHVIFMRPDSTLVELIPYEFHGRFHYQMFARYAGIAYKHVPVKGADRHKTGFNINPGKLVAVIRNILRRSDNQSSP